jgi:outer membrane murein-binding lipoprotein Lpp
MFLQKIKQQFLDNVVLIVVLAAGAVGSFKTVQVKVRVSDLAELQTKVAQLENNGMEMARMQDELDDLRLEMAKHLLGHSRTAGKK